MRPVAPICICLVVCGSAAVANPPPLLPEAYVGAMADELSGETAKRNLEGLARVEYLHALKAIGVVE